MVKLGQSDHRRPKTQGARTSPDAGPFVIPNQKLAEAAACRGGHVLNDIPQASFNRPPKTEGYWNSMMIRRNEPLKPRHSRSGWAPRKERLNKEARGALLFRGPRGFPYLAEPGLRQGVLDGVELGVRVGADRLNGA